MDLEQLKKDKRNLEDVLAKVVSPAKDRFLVLDVFQ